MYSEWLFLGVVPPGAPVQSLNESYAEVLQ